MKTKYLVGIDEAGRGPLAGPVAVGVVIMPVNFKPVLTKYSVKDSKKLSEKNREKWYKWLIRERRLNKINFAIALISHEIIDQRGIGLAVKLGIKKCLNRLILESNKYQFFLDGGLRAPARFKNQRTVIKGDEKEPIIALASIVAKVRRDRYMIRLAKKYPQYNFQTHKGYGTTAHYAALKKYGPSIIHRLSFLRKRFK